MNKSTIVAVATPPGKGGVGIVRLSGDKACNIGETLTQTSLKPRYATFTPFINPEDNSLLDEGIALYFKGPNSFTGEDVVELQGHGGPVILDLLVKACIAQGAELAKPGEFSERAFLNDKIDLTQAEAIADLIDSASEQAAKNAIQSLQGTFSKTINQLVKDVTALRVFIEAAIDFPEEEIDFITESNVLGQVTDLHKQVTAILQEAKQGQLLQEGANLVITGKPNAGKSSLLNALAGQDIAIVTAVAGTTRDSLRENLIIEGIPVHITDTAGLRESNDIVEREGIKRAEKALKTADAVLLVIDSNDPEAEGYFPENTVLQDKPLIRVFNKIDESGLSVHQIQEQHHTDIYLSAKTLEGLTELRQLIAENVGKQQQSSRFSARRRHIDALERAKVSLNHGLHQLKAFGAAELLAEDLKDCQQHLSSITGQFSADDLLGEIFSSFCIGK